MFKKVEGSERGYLCILDIPSSLGNCNLTIIHHTFSTNIFTPCYGHKKDLFMAI